MRKYFITGLFICLMCASLGLLFGPTDTASILEENREPQAMPKMNFSDLWNGKFSSDFEQYVNDHVAFRGKLMGVSDKIRSRMGYIPDDIGRIIDVSSDIGTGEANEGRLVVYDGYIMEMFKKNDETNTKYAESLNEIRRSLPKDVRMYSMLIPTALEFSSQMYSSMQDSQKEAIDSVNDKLSGVFPVDAYSALQSSDDEYLYFKTDHHWTMDGAYCAYEKFMEMSGGSPVLKSDFSRRENGNFHGSLYLKAKSQLIEQEQDLVFYYDVTEKNDFDIKMRAEDNVTEYGVGSPMFQTDKNNYLLFFGGDNPLMEITNKSNPEGKTIVVIKDSYANALLPWIASSYHKVIVIDPRSFGGSVTEEANNYSADEVLVVNYVFSTTFSDYCDMLTNIK